MLIMVTRFILLTLSGLHARFIVNDTYRAIGYNYRQRFLVFHYTAVNFSESVRILTGPYVSSHYLIPEGPVNNKREIYRLVPENLRAWTQGVSYWRGRYNLNDQGIGVEIVNLGYRDINNSRTYFNYTSSQIQSAIELCLDVVRRYKIDPENVIGHSDCSPGRKVDPGPLFPWKLLYDNGCGAWPDQHDVDCCMHNLQYKKIERSRFLRYLKSYGYRIKDTSIPCEVETVVKAFQMHFRPRLFDGVIDKETYAILMSLMKKYRRKRSYC